MVCSAKGGVCGGIDLSLVRGSSPEYSSGLSDVNGTYSGSDSSQSLDVRDSAFDKPRFEEVKPGKITPDLRDIQYDITPLRSPYSSSSGRVRNVRDEFSEDFRVRESTHIRNPVGDFYSNLSKGGVANHSSSPNVYSGPQGVYPRASSCCGEMVDYSVN